MSSSDSTPDDAFSKLLQKYRDAAADDNLVDAEATAYEIFAFAEEWCDQNPSPDFGLAIAAAQCEERADWDGAESAYKRILLLPDLDPRVESKAHSDLASLYRVRNRDSDALRHARLATSAARRTDVSVLLATVLQGEARCLIGSNRIDAASAVAAEACAVLGNEKMYDPLRGSALTVRAECAVRAGQLSDAERDLERAFDLIQPMAGIDIAAGVHGNLARWWSVTARLRDAREDYDGAARAWQEAVAISQHVASLPHADSVYAKLAVADMLNGLGDALSRCGRADDAATAFDERNEIRNDIGVPNTDAE